jgi:class 3 adenylate cyclase
VDKAPHEIRYAAVGDADVAYQVVGDGPFDVVCFYGLGSHIDLLWDFSPPLVGLFSSFCRTIQFDRRGTGASDGVPRNAIPTWEEWTEDLRVVLDAAESERAAIYAEVDAGPIALLFTAMHPERVSALVLTNTSARYLVDENYPIGVSQADCDALIRMLETSWGTTDLVRVVFPTAAHDAESVRLFARMLRAAATPRTAAAQYRYILESVDVRSALHLIRVPTLVIHNVQNTLVPIEHGRYIADHIEGAKLIEIPSAGDVNLIGGVTHQVVGDVAEFLTGERPSVDVHRVLTTVLFTDIVGSTELAATIGDHRWGSLLDAHDRAVRDQLRHFRGREVNTTGDGFCASFDGPARAIRCACAIIEAAAQLGVDVRAGLHAGECERRGNDLGGIAVHVAARVGALARSGEVLVTGTVEDLVGGSGIRFEDRGLHELKGVPKQWRLLAVEDT